MQLNSSQTCYETYTVQLNPPKMRSRQPRKYESIQNRQLNKLNGAKSIKSLKWPRKNFPRIILTPLSSVNTKLLFFCLFFISLFPQQKQVERTQAQQSNRAVGTRDLVFMLATSYYKVILQYTPPLQTPHSQKQLVGQLNRGQKQMSIHLLLVLHKSCQTTKFFKIHKISPDKKQNMYMCTNIKHKFAEELVFSILPLLKACKARTCWYHHPTNLIYQYQIF